MKKLFTGLAILNLVILSFIARADIRLPAIIGDHMVLQQNSDCKLWGWSNSNEKITIINSWDTSHVEVRALGDAKWIATIKTPKAGGPFTITLKGYNEVVIKDVLVGEVWDCSGQSNMEMSDSWGKQLYSDELSQANNDSIRLFQIPRLTSEYPQDDTKGQWVVCNPADVKKFSMAGYFFGKKLQETLKVPIGLINASWGGTPAETWTPKDSIMNNPVLKESASHLKPDPNWPVLPSLIYNAEIHPLTNFNIAGVIWYQGEANVGTASTYSQVFTTMINSWRTAWKKDLPFYYVQIAPFEGYGKTNNGSILREQQTKTLAVPNTGMVVVHDLVENIKDIHPRDKKDVGIRLANLALSKTYGIPGLPYQYPMFKEMKIEKGKARISFINADQGLTAKGDTLQGFYIAGADRNFVPATAKISGNTVIVSSKEVKEPVAVRFGFTSASMPNLFNREGLPANMFRTDDWDDVQTLK